MTTTDPAHDSDWAAVADALSDRPHEILEDVAQAATDPAAYLDRFTRELALRGISAPDRVSPWIAFIDALQRRGELIELDWKADNAEVHDAVVALVRQRTGGDGVVSPTDSDYPYQIPGSFTINVRKIQGRQWVLAMLDIHSDSYPVALCRRDAATVIGRNAKRTGNRIQFFRP